MSTRYPSRGKVHLEDLSAVIPINISARHTCVELFVLTPVLPRCTFGLHLPSHAYVIEEIHCHCADGFLNNIFPGAKPGVFAAPDDININNRL